MNPQTREIILDYVLSIRPVFTAYATRRIWFWWIVVTIDERYDIEFVTVPVFYVLFWRAVRWVRR